ncbi:hypothetical protein DBR00_14360 [Pseudomonas sp. HMWF032]|nr:hypothetical protein DBR00_14360 [Pseudomonas sp. HMWF032]PTT84220.1 hypothetical protein DBR41_08400 [Pseudomonas sp. HMWF010]
MQVIAQQLTEDQVSLLEQPGQLSGRMCGIVYVVQRCLQGVTAFALADVVGHGNAHLVIR